MEQTFNVSGMSCQHCVMAVKKAVSRLPGAGAVDVILGEKKVIVSFDPALLGPEQISAAIEAIGYRVSAK